MPVIAADEVQLENVSAEKIELKKPEIRGKESLLVDDKAVVEELIRLQKEKDIEDIENLWNGTVANNKVIEFALKKLATPESERRIHSSLYRGKSLRTSG